MYPRTMDPNKCQTTVPTQGLRMHYHQCTRPVIPGTTKCKIHDPKYIAEKNRVTQEKWDKKWAVEKERRDAPLRRIGELEAEVEALKEKLERLRFWNGKEPL